MANTRAQKSRLVSYLDLQARKLRLDLEAARLFVGTTDIGNVAESAVRHFLDSLLPARYSVGVGEAIAANGQLPQRVEQTQQKDVVIYDTYGSAVLGWGQSGINLFPVESIYGVIEVKTAVRSTDDLVKAVDQTLEVKKICQDNRHSDQKPPFTGVFVFESTVRGDELFDALKRRSPDKRADFALILAPDASNPSDSFYFAHWHYFSKGGGPIRFVTAEEAAQERVSNPSAPDKHLTFGDTELALLWFYLFLVEQLDAMRLSRPNLWKYADASKRRLGWRDDES